MAPVRTVPCLVPVRRTARPGLSGQEDWFGSVADPLRACSRGIRAGIPGPSRARVKRRKPAAVKGRKGTALQGQLAPNLKSGGGKISPELNF